MSIEIEIKPITVNQAREGRWIYHKKRPPETEVVGTGLKRIESPNTS